MRSWDGITLTVRQILYLAVTKTGELKIEGVEDAHNILDNLSSKQSNEEKESWVKSRYPKAYLLFEDLKAGGRIPSLKVLEP